jgi:CRP-like cAMP-binding protein
MPPNSVSTAALSPADLAKVELFAALKLEQLQRLLEQHRARTMAADQMVVLERDESQGIFLVRDGMMVRSGMVKRRCFVLQGEKTVLALLHNEPRLTQALAQLQSKQLQTLNRRMRLRASNANLRLLAMLAERAARSAPRAAATDPIPPLPQREFASLAGTGNDITHLGAPAGAVAWWRTRLSLACGC